MSISDYHTYAIDTAGQRWCTGLNNYGQLGLGDRTDRWTVSSLGDGGVDVWITTGGSHTCSISAARRLYCWGENKHGEVGIGNTTEQTLPALVS